MRIYNISQAQLKELLSSRGNILQGKILAVSRGKVVIDFGSFIGEGKWEADLPLPEKGETLTFAVKSRKFPLVLKVIKAKNKVEFERLPEIEIQNIEQKEQKEEIANFLKAILSIKRHKEKSMPEGEKAKEAAKTTSKTEDTPVFAMLIPIKVDDSQYELKLIINYDEEEEIYMVSFVTSTKELGNVKADLYYTPTKGKKLIINLQTSQKEAKKLMEKKKGELEANLKKLGFTPYINVTYNPNVNKNMPFQFRKSLIEKRV